MKKAILYVGAALAMVFSLNSCNKEIQDPEEVNVVKQGTPFAIVANPVETRTENDGMSTKWVADDAINVFHAEAGTTNYVSDGQFTIAAADLESSVFRGTVADGALEADNSYDWYMFYPYTSQMVTPGQKTKGYVTVGSSATGTQTQSGNNSMAHLAGSNVPLLGKIANVSSTAMPSVSVNQACAFLEINVTNLSGSDLTVSQVVFTGTEPIVGTYYIDFAGENVVYTGSGDNYVSNFAKLTVTDGSAIANAGSAKFYLAIKPFSAPSNGKLKISVNGYEKEITLSSAVGFAAGKIKKINFDYDDAPYVFTPEQFELATSILPGDRIIITSSTTGSVSVMKHYESGNNYKAVSATVSGGVITSTEDMAVLEVGGETGYLTFYDEVTKSYLNATSATSNYLKASSSVDDFAKWNVSFSSNAAIIKNTGSGKTNYSIRYNKSSATNLLFSCYTSGQNSVFIFKKPVSLVLDNITLDYSACQTEFYVNDDFSYEGLEVTAHYTNGASLAVTPTSVSSPNMNEEGTKTVTVTYSEGGVTATATYVITVSSRPTYIVTLADDSTQLTVQADASVTLPSRTATVEGYSFEGWSTTEITVATTTEPDIIPAGSYTPTESITLYPIFSTGQNTTCWVQTALSDVTAGRYVLISSNGVVFNGVITSGHGQSTTGYLEFENGIAATLPDGACILTLTESGDGFTMYNPDYGYLYASKAASGGLAWHQTENSYWYYSYLNDQDNWVYANNNARLRTYSGSFRTYAANSNSPLTIAKETVISNNKTYITYPE